MSFFFNFSTFALDFVKHVSKCEKNSLTGIKCEEKHLTLLGRKRIIKSIIRLGRKNSEKARILGKNCDVRAMALTPCSSGLLEMPQSRSMGCLSCINDAA